MKTYKIDKRVVKTKSNLKKALIQLLAKKSIDDISIVELAEIATINRKTFYLHYQDVNSILNEIKNNFSEDILKIVKDYDLSFAYLKDFIYNIYNTIINNPYIVGLLKNHLYGYEIVSLLEKVLIDSLSNKALKSPLYSHDVNLNFVIQYHVYASVSMFYNWFILNNNDISFREMIAKIYSVVINTYKR